MFRVFLPRQCHVRAGNESSKVFLPPNAHLLACVLAPPPPSPSLPFSDKDKARVMEMLERVEEKDEPLLDDDEVSGTSASEGASPRSLEERLAGLDLGMIIISHTTV